MLQYQTNINIMESEGRIDNQYKQSSGAFNRSTRSSSVRRRRKQESCCCCLTRGKFPCCCCGKRSRKIFVIIAVVTDLVVTTYLCMIYAMFVLTPQEEITNSMQQFFEIFNPFRNLGRRDVDGSDAKVLKNVMFISVPLTVWCIYKTYNGVTAWISDFELTETERYYRISLTYTFYVFLIRFLITILIQFKIEYIILYLTDFFYSYIFLLRNIRGFIGERKQEEIDEARRLDGH